MAPQTRGKNRGGVAEDVGRGGGGVGLCGGGGGGGSALLSASRRMCFQLQTKERLCCAACGSV